MNAKAETQGVEEQIENEELRLLEEEETVSSHFGVDPLMNGSVLMLDFKPLRYGDREVSLAQGSLFAGDILNGIARACTRAAAMEYARIALTVLPHRELFEAADSYPSIDLLFDDAFNLREEYKGELTPVQIDTLERNYAAYQAAIATGDEVAKAWDKAFEKAPNRRDRGPVYGFEGGLLEPGGRGPSRPVVSFKTALIQAIERQPRMVAGRRDFLEVQERRTGAVGTSRRQLL